MAKDIIKVTGTKSLTKKSSGKKQVKIDKTSGAMAYNRLDMQVSQALYMAIELYDSLDYIFVMDHYDDITIFDVSKKPYAVSYYQMKTHKKSISISTVLSQDWFAKLYAHLQQKEWIIKELGLITNCQLDVDFKVIDTKGKQKKQHKSYDKDRTAFTGMPQDVVDRIKKDISTKLEIPIEEVDLTKFVHMHTELSIGRHREIAEGTLSEFLYKKNSTITVETVKAIFDSMFRLLSDRQKYEGLGEDCEFDSVVKYKGVYKSEFTKIMADALLISMPPVRDVVNAAQCITKEEENKLCMAYVRVLEDQQSKPKAYKIIVLKVKEAIDTLQIKVDEPISDYALRICRFVYSSNNNYSYLYGPDYIKVMIICIILNGVSHRV